MEWELSILRWIQSFSNPFLDEFFQVVTMLGEQIAVIGILAVVYWLWDKKKGQQLAFTLLVSGLLNNVLKGIFRLERPVGQEGIRTLRHHTATGYSSLVDTRKMRRRCIFIRPKRVAVGGSGCWRV